MRPAVLVMENDVVIIVTITKIFRFIQLKKVLRLINYLPFFRMEAVLTARQVVTVTVTDVQDTPPFFLLDSYRAAIVENEAAVRFHW